MNDSDTTTCQLRPQQSYCTQISSRELNIAKKIAGELAESMQEWLCSWVKAKEDIHEKKRIFGYLESKTCTSKEASNWGNLH